MFGFLGPNGAGKTTTIRAILDFIRPTSGSITVLGHDSQSNDLTIKEKTGYLAGDIALYENMTGRNLLKHLTALGRDTDWEYVSQLTEQLNASLDRRIHTLSKGNKQKIGLIQAFMHKPELILLDEPTIGLDPLMKEVFYTMVSDIRAEGRTILVSSHDLTEVQKICDRAAFIRDGTLVATEDLKHNTNLNLRRYTATLETEPTEAGFGGIEGVSDVEIAGNQVTVTITGSVAPFITELARHNPVDLDEQETSLEDVFMHYYAEGEADA